MLKNYRDLKVWQKSYKPCLDLLVLIANWRPSFFFQVILTYVNEENLKALKGGTEEVERMLKALIKSLENKRLNP